MAKQTKASNIGHGVNGRITRELRADATKPEVRIDPVQGLVVRSGAGWEIRFGTPDQLEQKLSNAKKVLSDEPTRRLDYVDVRSPDRIVFSPQ